MRRTRSHVFVLSTLAVTAVCTAVALAATGVKTTKPPYLVSTASGVTVDPILSTRDVVPRGQTPAYQMSGIPDGLGAFSRGHDHGHKKHGKGRGTYTVLMNHELGITFPGQPPGVDARISKLKIDRTTNSVLSAKYVFTGAEGFERFCSATLAWIHGTPWYFTGEEAINGIPPAPPAGHDGTSIAMNARTGQWFETEHFGHLQHENVVPTKLSKWFFLTTDDDFRAGFDAYLYAYIAKSFKAAISGNPSKGSLYVWKADNATSSSDIQKGQTLTGHFVPISQAENADSVALKNAAAAKGAFKFDRLEDAALSRTTKGRYYIADTGKRPRTIRGRIYQFDVSKSDPTHASLKLLLDGDNGDDIANPDNLDTSAKSLVIQEDRESEFRDEYNRVLVYDLKTGSLQPVARVNTPATLRPGTWESSGVINAFDLLGAGWWLLDVQAHSTTAAQPGPTLAPDSSTGEDGQLLAVYVPQTIGGHGRGHDDRDHGHRGGKHKKR
jgi:Alkaline phosphatase PhoX